MQSFERLEREGVGPEKQDLLPGPGRPVSPGKCDAHSRISPQKDPRVTAPFESTSDQNEGRLPGTKQRRQDHSGRRSWQSHRSVTVTSTSCDLESLMALLLCKDGRAFT